MLHSREPILAGLGARTLKTLNGREFAKKNELKL